MVITVTTTNNDASVQLERKDRFCLAAGWIQRAVVLVSPCSLVPWPYTRSIRKWEQFRFTGNEAKLAADLLVRDLFRIVVYVQWGDIDLYERAASNPFVRDLLGRETERRGETQASSLSNCNGTRQLRQDRTTPRNTSCYSGIPRPGPLPLLPLLWSSHSNAEGVQPRHKNFVWAIRICAMKAA